MNLVWTSFDKIGLLVNLGLMALDVACEIATTAATCWKRLLPYIEFERERGRASHLVYFEELAEASEQHWSRRNVEAPARPLRRTKWGKQLRHANP